MLVDKLKKTFKKPMFWVTVLGVSLVPALYNLSFLSSMWNPYGRVDQLPVAVVNEDKKAYYNGRDFAIGDDMVERMKESKSLDFHFVSKKDAEDGLKDGDYYMVITLPENLSENATTLLTDHPEKMTIEYETSQGHSFVASKMSDSAMTQLEHQVSENVTQTYNRAVFSSMSQLQGGLEKAVEGTKQLQDGTSRLSDGGKTLTDGLYTFKDGMITYTNGVSQLSAGSGQLAANSDQLTSGAAQLSSGSGQLVDGLSTLNASTGPLVNGVNQLANGSNQLDQNSGALLSGMQQLQAGTPQVQTLANGLASLSAGIERLSEQTDLSADKRAQLQALQEGLPQLQAGIDQLHSQVSQLDVSGLSSIDTSGLEAALTQLAQHAQGILSAAQTDRANALTAVQATAAYQAMTADQQAEITAAISNSPSTVADEAQGILSTLQSLQASLAPLKAGLGQLQNKVSSLTALQAGVAQLKAASDQAIPGANVAITELTAAIDQIHSGVSGQLLPGSQQAATGAATLANALSSGTSQLVSGFTTYASGVSTLNNGLQTLNNQTGQLTSGVSRLADGSQTLQGGIDRLATGLDQYTAGVSTLDNGIKTLDSNSGQLTSGVDRLADGSQTLTSGLGALASGVDQMNGSLGDASQQLSSVSVEKVNADAVTSPVATSHTDHDQVATNGVGMAPYMMAVSLMVVALSTNVVFAKSIDEEEYTNRWDWAKSKLLLNGLIATLTAIFLYATVHFVGVDFAHPVETFWLTLLSSWTLMALVTALIGWDQRLGSFASLIILVLQLGSSAGTYPIELSPRFFGIVQPYLPMTYVVSGLRQTISMAGSIGNQVTALSIFLLGFMVLGLLIFRPHGQQESVKA